MIYCLAVAPELNIFGKCVAMGLTSEKQTEWKTPVVCFSGDDLCRMLNACGVPCMPVLFLGGSVGKSISDFIEIRKYLKIECCSCNDLRVTVNDNGNKTYFAKKFAVNMSEIDDFIAKMDKFDPSDCLIIPHNTEEYMPVGAFDKILSSAEKRGVTVIMSVRDEKNLGAFKYFPEMAVLDKKSLQSHFGKVSASESDIIDYADKIAKAGAKTVVIILGNKLIAVDELSGVYKCEISGSKKSRNNPSELFLAGFMMKMSDDVAFSDCVAAGAMAMYCGQIDKNLSIDAEAVKTTVLREQIKRAVIRSVAHYLKDSGDVTFSDSPLNILDFAIMSQFPMMNLEKIENESLSFSKVRKRYLEKNPAGYANIGLIIPQFYPLLSLCADSKRYSSIRLIDRVVDIDEERVVQFSAITYKLSKNEYCVAFSGTDDTIVGWKENFYLLYDKPTQSQTRAVNYLNNLAERTSGGDKIYVVGHSKGGNLAIYGSVCACRDFQDKLVAVYNFDGPGFTEEFYHSDGFNNIRDKVMTVIPQLSVIGRLFIHEEKVMIVKSCFSGVFQHDLLSWETCGNSFVTLPKLDELSNRVQEKVNEIAFGLSSEQRKIFVEGLFSMLYSTDSFTLNELTANRGKLFGSYFKCDAPTRRLLFSVSVKLFGDKYVRELVLTALKEVKKWRRKKNFEEKTITSGDLDKAIDSISMLTADSENIK